MIPPLDPLEIPLLKAPLDAVVRVPGSKSITNRALVLAALASGTSRLEGPLFSDDSRHLLACLKALGFGVRFDEEAGFIEVEGAGGSVPSVSAELFVGNAGTAARFLPPLAALAKEGKFRFDGDPRMRGRPMAGLLGVLEAQGAALSGLEESRPGYPFTLDSRGLKGGEIHLDIGESSQFASGLLMAGPFMREPLTLRLSGGRSEIPYVDMTAAMMRRFGARVERAEEQGRAVFRVARGGYRALAPFAVEPDLSGACYFFAAAALAGGKVTVPGLGRESMQGDIRFLALLKHLGCQFYEDPEGLTLEKDPATPLDGADVDMNAFSDQALTLAALAPFCRGPVRIRNVAHIRGQESDRIAAALANLEALGARARATGDGLEILPAEAGALKGADLKTFRDHRVAMAFSLAGLKVGGVRIKDPACVSKTFENFWFKLFGLNRIAIAIDGPAGSGKSTVAKTLARELGYLYVDTGAMYRTVTLAARRAGVDPADKEGLARVAREAAIGVEPSQGGMRVFLDGREVGNEIRTPEISRLTSQFTANAPGVRQAMVERQRRLGGGGGVVMEGRDISTVVLPRAELKVYLDASVQERTRRRIRDFEQRGIAYDAGKVEQDIRSRDDEDRARPVGALKVDPQAVLIQGDGKDPRKVIAEILGHWPIQGRA